MEAQVRIIIRSESRERLLELLRREELDLSCGGASQDSSGVWAIEAYVLPEVATRLRQLDYRIEIDQEFEQRMTQRRMDVGTGDRFEGGQIPPRGLGRKE